jgi:ankyrin repeat protein
VINSGAEPEIIRLFDSGADPNVKDPQSGETPLMAATTGNSLSLVKYLVSKGADPNRVSKKGVTALSVAATRGYAGIVKVLVDHGADIRYLDSNRLSALFYAAARGHLDIARILMAKGADIRIRANNGATALIDAVQNYYDDSDEWNVKDNDGKTALDYAFANSADEDVIELLREKTSR